MSGANVRRILVPIDFSECSRAALDRAVELSRVLGAELVLLHVVDSSGLFVGGIESYVDVAAIARQMQEDARKELAAIAATAAANGRPGTRIEVYEGRPAQAIVDCAKEQGVDLIVMGTHGRSGLSRVFLGSVAERVVRTAPCDVLVVHAKK
jgi:universal stress protein A